LVNASLSSESSKPIDGGRRERGGGLGEGRKVKSKKRGKKKVEMEVEVDDSTSTNGLSTVLLGRLRQILHFLDSKNESKLTTKRKRRRRREKGM